MWRKEDGRQPNPNEISTGPVNAATPSTSAPPVRPSTPAAAVSPNAVACISQGIRIKGEITGAEDLFIDGTIEGKLNFQNAVLTVGPNATIKADIIAREIVVRGRVHGKLEGSDRVQIWSSARVNGDIRAERVAIEEGAELHGKMEAGKAPVHAAESPARKTDSSKPKVTEAATGSTASGAAVAGAN